jgi:hypothetical protein
MAGAPALTGARRRAVGPVCLEIAQLDRRLVESHTEGAEGLVTAWGLGIRLVRRIGYGFLPSAAR